MPIYEYECMKCGKIDEVVQKFSDKQLTKCKHCSGKLNKLVSHSSFHLKGTGWYATDYANKSSSSSTPPKAEKKASTEEPKASNKQTEKSGKAAEKTP